MVLQGTDQWRFDLPAANAQQLAAAGVRNIERSRLCTACHNELFFSHRAEEGRTGRFAAVAYLTSGNGNKVGTTAHPHREATESGEEASAISLHPPGFPTFEEMLGGST